MLTIFMPSGLSGVPWMGLVASVFLIGMISVLFTEPSVKKNAVFAFCIWLPMIGLHLASPGTKTIEEGKVMDGVWFILSCAIAHTLIQSILRALISKSTKVEPVGGDQ
jgi:Na+/phosphate symporter